MTGEPTAPLMASLISAASLMHPDGQAITLALSHAGVEQAASPQAAAGVIVADVRGAGPGAPGLLSSLAASLAAALEPDGLAYVLVRPTDIGPLRQLLNRHALTIVEERMHLPVWGESLALTPTAGLAPRFALKYLTPALSLRARLAAWVSTFAGGGQRLARFLPVAGLVVRRPGARPLFQWLANLEIELHGETRVIVQTGWTHTATGATLTVLPDGGMTPAAAIKVGAREDRQRAEAGALNQLAPTATASGAAAPRVLGQHQVGDRWALAQTALSGQVAAVRLLSHPGDLPAVATRVAAWLERWNSATRVVQPLTAEQLRAAILAPAEALASHTDGIAEYRIWLQGQCASLVGQPAPLVAAHNDLTMWNILLDDHGRLGIVDWESAHPSGFPLTDMYYALVDGAAAAGRYRDRVAAFQTCFAKGGALAHLSSRWRLALSQSLDLHPKFASLCWHSTWLMHAANEAGQSYDHQRPFLRIVEQIALRPEFRAGVQPQPEPDLPRSAGAP